MNISFFESRHYLKSVWSGGTTTQLYISPAEASYAECNFDVRISTAKVEAENSTFTSLPGVQRKLMILEGEITINHKNLYCKHLKPFDIDAFQGDWETTAKGTCTDFNVMTRGNIQSELSYLEIAPNSRIEMKLEEPWNTLFLFLLKGNLYIKADQKYILKKDNLLVMNNINLFQIPIHAIEHSQIVVTKIRM